MLMTSDRAYAIAGGVVGGLAVAVVALWRGLHHIHRPPARQEF